MLADFRSRIEQKLRGTRPTVGVGVLSPTADMIGSLRKAAELVDIVVYGCQELEGFRCVPDDPANPHALMEAAKSGSIVAIHKGDLDPLASYQAFSRCFAIEPEAAFPAFTVLELMQGPAGHPSPFHSCIVFFPYDPTEDCHLALKIAHIQAAVEFWRIFEVEPVVGVLSCGKREWVTQARPWIDRSLADAEFLVNYFQPKIARIEHYEHRLERAITECNILVWPDAVSGNLAGRALAYFAKSHLWGGVIWCPRATYVEVPQLYRDWEASLLLAAAIGCSRSSMQAT